MDLVDRANSRVASVQMLSSIQARHVAPRVIVRSIRAA
jgi:hypothetical protein